MSPIYKEVPIPKRYPVVGHLPKIWRQGMLGMLQGMWERHGDLVELRLGPQRAYLAIDPKYLKHILLDNRDNYIKGDAYDPFRLLVGNGLVTSNGDLWRRQRRLVQPSFQKDSMKVFVEKMVETSVEVLERWGEDRSSLQRVDMAQEMMQLTMRVIGKTMFGVDLDDETDRSSKAFKDVMSYVIKQGNVPFRLPLWIPIPSNIRLRKALNTLDSIVYGIINARKADPGEHSDFLSMCLNATDKETGEGMSDEQVRDEVVTMFLAGHETTSNALTWTWYLLSQHPEVEARLHAELDEVLGGRLPTFEDLRRLPYTMMVLQESMRLYPPVWLLARNVANDDEINGFPIKAGSIMMFSSFLTHRHPEYWENPEQFDPERFRPEAIKARDNFAYLPFSLGPRLCMGKHFALYEGMLVLATLGQRYRCLMDPYQKHVEMLPETMLQPRDGLPMCLIRR